ncbi:HMA2 domain-containing protein [Limnothrix sp. FACHB-881]|uniref:HMA2 domain-containing protein n=1 Tax=Limnothrix sp. FACHB-881 TaxID=2692819 RepID=UPI0018EFBC86|nr:hypothetical protein [Limnothrix sp. FACHB-881]
MSHSSNPDREPSVTPEPQPLANSGLDSAAEVSPIAPAFQEQPPESDRLVINASSAPPQSQPVNSDSDLAATATGALAQSTPSGAIEPGPDSAYLTLSAQLGQWLQEYGEITTILPVLAGLFVTTRFQLRGSRALLTNLAIAAVVRQVILYFKQQANSSAGTLAMVTAGAALATVTAAPAPSNQSAAAAQTSPISLTELGNNLGVGLGCEDCTIVHSVPGRIRLRIDRLRTDRAYGKRLETLLKDEPIVLGTRINQAAASLAIQYDSTGLSDLELGLRLLQVLNRANQD